MPLTSHVTNYELSKRLKENGLSQESCFYWAHSQTTGEWYLTEESLVPMRTGTEEDYCISAFLASEVGEWIPREINRYGKTGWLRMCNTFDGKGWMIWYEDEDDLTIVDSMTVSTLPDAMGKMVLYLAESGLIKF